MRMMGTEPDALGIYDSGPCGPVDRVPHDDAPGVCRLFTPVLAAVGVTDAIGATAAGVLAPALTGAAIGGITGGGQGALFGALGGALGGGADEIFGSGNIGSDLSGALGLGGTGNTGAAAYDALSPEQQVASDVSASDAAGGGSDAAGNAAISSVLNGGTGGTSATGGLGPVASTAAASSGKGLNTTALALASLAGAGSMFSKPQIGTWQTPGPSSTSATQGPLWNQSLNPSSFPQRTAVNPMAGQPASAWYTYGQQPGQSFYTNNAALAKGGALRLRGASAPAPVPMARGAVAGPGDGKSDSVPARLSDGEFVFDAQTVARLGNGSSAAGAKKLEEFRRLVARDAGSNRVLQKSTKSPQHYLGALSRAA